MWLICFLIIILLIFWAVGVSSHIMIEKDKTIELEKMRNHIQHLQDTLDHYGMRMSNKISDGNKYYKRWHK